MNFPIGFVKGFHMRFRISKNQGFALGFLCFKGSKTALNPPGNCEAIWMLFGYLSRHSISVALVL